MLIFRRFIATILGITAFFVLLTAAQAITFNLAFAKPAHVEKLLADSKLYDHFISNVIQQAQQSSKDSGGGVSISDPAVQQAAEQAFPPSQLQAYVNTFLDANYAWLQGKTDKPQFSIDLTEARQTFASNIGKAVESHLAALPVCTASQAAALAATDFDPLTVECRPASVNPAVEGQKVEQKLLDGSVLSTPVLTADTISPKGGTPYYESAKFAPTAYTALTVAPYALVAVFLVLCVLIFFITPRRRSGLRAIGFILAIAGLLMVAGKYGADVAYQKAQARLFNDSSVGPLQQSLTSFLQQLEHFIASYYLYIGVGCIVLGVLCIVLSIVKRSKSTKKIRATSPPQTNLTTQSQEASASTSASSSSAQRVTAPPLSPRAASSSNPQKPKRPRLIQ